MPRKVEFQGTVHEFPDSATDDQIRTALQGGAQQAAPAAPRTWLDSAGDFGKGLWGNLVQSGEGMVQAIKHPVDALKGIGASQDAVRLKAEGAFKRGDYVEGMRHALGYIIPLVGPQIDASGDKAQQGKVAESLGEATGTALQLAGPKLLEGAKIPISPKITSANPTEAAALDYLESKGAPANAAARTGNTFVKNAQRAADSTPLGAVVAAQAEKATTGALKTEAGSLANRAHPAPVVPEQAGAGTKAALDTKAAGHAAAADTAYEEFRRIEGLPQNARTVQTGTSQQPAKPSWTQTQPGPQPVKVTPINQTMQLPVDLRAIKKGLDPIYSDMQKWMEPAKRNASAGFQAIKSIMEGPDYVPASQAEVGLGGLKTLAREGEGRNAGLAKLMTSRLQQTIDQTVSAAGPDAIGALQKGRAATAAQYGVKSIADQLRSEPVQAFRQMIYAKDAGIDLLRNVAKEAPGEMRKVGRAWLEDAFGKAQESGGFGHAAKLYSDWENLGPETKKILFNPLLVSDLDKFFLGAKKLAENPNPSGTALVSISGGSGALIVTNPQTGIPLALGAGALSKMLHSSSGVKALTNGMKLPLKAPASALAAGQILKMAGSDVQPISLPAAAQADQSEQIGLTASARTAR